MVNHPTQNQLPLIMTDSLEWNSLPPSFLPPGNLPQARQTIGGSRSHRKIPFLPISRLASVSLQCTHVLLVTRVSLWTGFLPLLCGVSFFSLSFSTGEPRPAWEARMDVLERPGAVACRDGQGRRRRRVAHLARQVEEVYHKQRGTIGLPLSHRLSHAVGIGASRAS